MNKNMMTLKLTFYPAHLSPLNRDPQSALSSAGGNEGMGCDSVNGLVGR